MNMGNIVQPTHNTMATYLDAETSKSSKGARDVFSMGDI
jgi:hypothetical protein